MSPVQAALPCTHRYRIAEQIDPVTHRWPSRCVHCGMEKALSGGDPDNPFQERSGTWNSKLGDLGKSGIQSQRRELVLNAEASGAFMAQERARRVAGPPAPREPRHGTMGEYNVRGCRCEPCTAAVRTYTRERRQLKRAAS